MERGPCASVRLRHGINLAAVARRAVDEVPVGIRRQVLHFHELLIDITVHLLHIASAALGTLVVLGEVLLHVAMFAGYSQRFAISQVHDQKKSRGWSLLEDLDILEHLSRRLLLVPGYLFGNLLYESVVDFLIGRLFGGLLRGGWGRLLRRSLLRPASPSRQDHRQNHYHAYCPSAFHIALLRKL